MRPVSRRIHPALAGTYLLTSAASPSEEQQCYHWGLDLVCPAHRLLGYIARLAEPARAEYSPIYPVLMSFPESMPARLQMFARLHTSSVQRLYKPA